ncbi:LLM class flavin-dependent oxidoreductase [Cumulibacter manganitolerans]|uniref:LLM class flavin-dependent oxidoreductase n=1 Tax=Cumulibacter manganitolerans TaxID=1884992 RepID=UPI0012979BD7|nr:LLM class flavin-dependent oxidoreductase [Cumulibacter manganitolerans]
MDISCAFATSLQTPEHIAIADSLGYRRAWAYDSPALYPDVWAMLYAAAERTERIALGPGVLVPSLRHPMTNAAAIAGLCAIAPGRVVVAVGSGFTGRHALGQRPMKWRDVRRYVEVLRALLAGEVAEWEGAPIKMLHGPGFAAARPIDVPILIGANGPLGTEVAKAVGDGIFAAAVPNERAEGWQALLMYGTVLEDGEDGSSPRVVDAAGHALAVRFHAMYERQGADGVRRYPGGEAWVRSVEAAPADQRHLAVHEGHMVTLNEHDREAVADAATIIRKLTLTGSRAEIRDRVAAYAEQGVTEIAYQPAGSDIPRELEAFMSAVGS